MDTEGEWQLITTDEYTAVSYVCQLGRSPLINNFITYVSTLSDIRYRDHQLPIGSYTELSDHTIDQYNPSQPELQMLELTYGPMMVESYIRLLKALKERDMIEIKDLEG